MANGSSALYAMVSIRRKHWNAFRNTGMDLEVEAQEKQVGPFRADILCKDAYSDSWVLIENQLKNITDI